MFVVLDGAARSRAAGALTRAPCGCVLRAGIARVTDTWAGTGESGERFLVADHPYAADLDLFGRGSLFELLTTARIRAGEETLARWLLAPATTSDVRARQEAVLELQPLLDLREDLALLGDESVPGGHPDLLTRWGGAPPLMNGALAADRSPQSSPGSRSSTLARLGARRDVGPLPFALVVIGEVLFSLAVLRPVRAILAGVEAPAQDLALLAGVFARFEREAFSAPRLRQIVESFRTAGVPPSRRIVQLQPPDRSAELAPQPAVRTARGIPVVGRAGRVRHRALAPRVRPSPRANGCKGSASSRPCARLPVTPTSIPPTRSRCSWTRVPASKETASRTRCFRAARAVPNTVHLGGALQMLLVSGSNMSGKSTLLRSVGTNAVLALAGAPVRAERLRISPLAIGATLRVQDSLQAGQSRFYAEITRVRAIVSLTAGAAARCCSCSTSC